MNDPHRIRFRTGWKFVCRTEATRAAVLVAASRAFRKPTGIRENQSVHFCFRPAGPRTVFFLNDEIVHLVTLDGLAFANITDIMQNSNKIEIQWNGAQEHVDQEFKNQITEQLEAWLEINTSPSNESNSSS